MILADLPRHATVLRYEGLAGRFQTSGRAPPATRLRPFPPGHPRPGRAKADRGQGMSSPESIIVCAAPRGWIWCVRLPAEWRQAGGIYAYCECGTATLEIEATSQAYCAIHHPSVLLRHGDYRIIGGGA